MVTALKSYLIIILLNFKVFAQDTEFYRTDEQLFKEALEALIRVLLELLKHFSNTI